MVFLYFLIVIASFIVFGVLLGLIMYRLLDKGSRGDLVHITVSVITTGSFLVIYILISIFTPLDPMYRFITSGQEKRVIAVLPADMRLGNDTGNITEITIRRAVLAGIIQNKRNYRYRTVDTSQIERIIEQHHFEASEWSNPDKVAEIGRALNADTIAIIVARPGSISSGIPENDPSNAWYNFEIVISLTLLDINSMETLGIFNGNIEGRNAGLSNSYIRRFVSAVGRMIINI